MENYGACDRCDQEEDTEHMLIDCDQYPLPIWQKLERIIQKQHPMHKSSNQDNSEEIIN